MIVTNREFLRRVSEPVDTKKENVQLLFYQLEQELKNSKIPGVGLAAVQIGQLKQVSIIRLKNANVNIYNPKIVETSGRLISTEGCLSLPGKGGKCPQYAVERFEEVTIDNGDGRRLQFTGFEALVLQHELDHMWGIVVADKEYRSLKVGRNERCPCNSGKKFKRCHIGDEMALQKLIVRALK